MTVPRSDGMPVAPRIPSVKEMSAVRPSADGVPAAPRIPSVKEMPAVRTSVTEQKASAAVAPAIGMDDTVPHAPPGMHPAPEPVVPEQAPAPIPSATRTASVPPPAGTPAPAPVASVPPPAPQAPTPAPAPVAVPAHHLSEGAIRAAAKAAASEVVGAEVAALAARLTRIEDSLKKLSERDGTSRTPPPPAFGAALQGVPVPSIAPAPWHVAASESAAPPAPSVPPPRPRMSSIPIAMPTVELPRDLENALDGSKRRRRTAMIVVFVLIALVGGLVAMMLASQIKAS